MLGRVELATLLFLVLLQSGAESGEDPVDDHRVRVRLPIGKHRPLTFPQGVHRFHPFQSPVEVTPLPTDPDVGLIHPPGTCRHH